VFWGTLGNQFVDWDDDRNLVNNPDFRGLGWPQLRWMLTNTLMGHWIPVTWITFGADYLLWGMNPFGYHLTNLLLHAASAVAFYFVALRLLRAAAGSGSSTVHLGALAAALFFAIHPLRVESVAWVTERRDVLSGLWLLLTILAYLRAAGAVGARRRWWLATSVACYALAAAAKSIVMTLPILLFILDVYPLRRLGTRWSEWTGPEGRRVLAEKIPYLLLALGTAGMAVHALRSYGETLAAPQPIGSRIVVALYGLWFYVWKTIVPFPISPLYQLPNPVDPADPWLIASAAAVIALTGVLLGLRRRWPAGLAVWVSYGVLLAPVSGIVQSGPHLVAARYSYLACLGWALLVGGLVSLLARRAAGGRPGGGWARAGLVAMVVCFVGLGVLSWRLTRIWHDSETLWSYVVSLDPASSLGHHNLGFAYLNQAKLDAAEREILTALRLDPEWELAQTTLAVILFRQGRLEQAGEARAQLGSLLLKHRKYRAAADLFQKEVNARPGDPAAHNNLGVALVLLGEVGPAIEHFEQALRINPRHEKARRNLAAARQPR
jgi:hypothetical protein